MQPNPAPDGRNTNANRRKWNELIDELADLTARELETAGLASDTARDIGVSVADALAASFGGMLLYIPRNAAKQVAARDAEILHELGSVDAMTLAVKFGVGVHAIYRAAHREKARRKAAVSPHRVETP